MTERKFENDYLEKAFACYRDLPVESYEFIARIIEVHKWIGESYRQVCENPALDPDKLYEMLRPCFERIYDHVFSPFLRQYRKTLFPFASVPGMQLENWIPKQAADAIAASIKMWNETQNQFMSGMANSFSNTNGLEGKESGKANHSPAETFFNMTPLALLSRMPDEEMTICYDMMSQFIVLLGETQYSLPKDYIVNLQKVVSAYPKMYRAAQKCEAMFKQTWEKSTKRFLAQMTQEGAPINSKEFFDLYRKVLTGQFSELLNFPEFIETNAGFTEASSDFIVALRHVIEAQLSLVPALPFVTTTDLDAVVKNGHGQKQRIDQIESHIRESQKNRSRSSSRELDALKRRISLLEAKLEDSEKAAHPRRIPAASNTVRTKNLTKRSN